MVGRDPTEILRPKSLAAAKFSGRRLLLDGRPESTYCGRSRPRPWTPQLGGKRAYKGRRGKARFPRDSRRSIVSSKKSSRLGHVNQASVDEFRNPSRKRGDLRHQCVDQRILNQRSGPADMDPWIQIRRTPRHLFPTPESIRRTCHANSAGVSNYVGPGVFLCKFRIWSQTP